MRTTEESGGKLGNGALIVEAGFYARARVLLYLSVSFRWASPRATADAPPERLGASVWSTPALLFLCSDPSACLNSNRARPRLK